MKKHKHHTNPLKRLEKIIMATLNELLAAIETITKGNPTDPAVLAKVDTLTTQMLAANAKLVANDADDAESKQINADQKVLIEALIAKLAAAPASTPSGVPVITSISPNFGSVNEEKTIILNGAGFSGATAVVFGNASVANLSVSGDTSITVTAPALPSGTYDITVVTPAGTSVVTSAGSFTVS